MEGGAGAATLCVPRDQAPSGGAPAVAYRPGGSGLQTVPTSCARFWIWVKRVAWRPHCASWASDERGKDDSTQWELVSRITPREI
jgi:hypothetical protein